MVSVEIDLPSPPTAATVASVIKRGEICIQTTLHRTHLGLTISVKVHPTVEDFIRNLGSGETQDVRIMGRHWQPIGTKPLEVWNLASNPGRLQTDDGSYFRIDVPGYPLLNPGGGRPDGEGDPVPTVGRGDLNLSFLRLVGASEGAGVEFGVKGVYTLDQCRQIRDRIVGSARRFYVNYLQPVDMTVMVSTQEINPSL